VLFHTGVSSVFNIGEEHRLRLFEKLLVTVFVHETEKIRSGLRQLHNVKLLNLYRDMTPESPNSSLLDNGSLGTFTRQRIDLWKNETVATKLTQVSAATNKRRRVKEFLEIVTYIRLAPKL
jgi:hypothetical protein